MSVADDFTRWCVFRETLCNQVAGSTASGCRGTVSAWATICPWVDLFAGAVVVAFCTVDGVGSAQDAIC